MHFGVSEEASCVFKHEFQFSRSLHFPALKGLVHSSRRDQSDYLAGRSEAGTHSGRSRVATSRDAIGSSGVPFGATAPLWFAGTLSIEF